MADSPNLEGSGLVTVTILVNGAPVDSSIQLVSVRVSKIINKISTAKIVLLDGDMPNKDFPVSNSDDFKPGAEITINTGYDQKEETIFKGIVVKHGLKITGNNYSRLVIECCDKAVKMTIGRNNANYIDSKDSDIMTKLIGNAGVTADVASTTVTYKDLTQYYCTDWDFMLSRAEVNGMLVLVDDGKVTVQKPQVSESPLLTVTYGEDLMEFDADVDAKSQLAAAKGVSWDPKTQATVEEEVSPQKLNAQGDLDSAELAKVMSPNSFRLQTAASLEKTAIKAWSEGQLVKAGLARIRGRMKFQGSAKAKIGTLLEVSGVGNRFNGNVFVSAVHHGISEGNWISEVEFGMPSTWFAERRDLVAPSASGLLPGVEGLQVGIVKKLDADPEGQHRVQVTIPVLQAETEGVWARLTKFYASNGFGSFFIPEVGDEVVLGYFNNDPSHPVILGSLYSSKRKPPYDLTAENFIKAITTTSELKFEFDDENKVMTLVTPGGNTIVISDKDKSILLQDQNNNKVELSSSGIVLDSPKDISITAKGKITVNAVGEIGITSKADVKLTGLNINNTANVGFVAKGNATAELSASGQTTVKGAMVMIN